MQDYSDIAGLYERGNSPNGAKRRGINSVETGIRILNAIVDLRGPCTLKAIAERSGMDPSQTHRYVSSLLNCRLLIQDPDTSLYDLGPMSLRLGLAAMARLDSIPIAESTIKRFSLEHRITCQLSVWGSNGPTVIRWYSGNPPVFTTLSLGSSLPVTTSSTGRVFMSFLREDLLETFLKDEGWKVPLKKNKELRELRDSIRRKFISSIDSRFIPGLRAHSAPIFAMQNTLICVVTIIANNLVEKARFTKLKAHLLSTCKNLSADLGGDWDQPSG